jgi:hypothetical protein
MMCADLDNKYLREFDHWLRGMIMSWLLVTDAPTCVSGMSWRDGGFTILSLQARQNTMIVRTMCDMITSGDPAVRKLMRQFEKEHGEALGFTIQELVRDEEQNDFLRLVHDDASDITKTPNAQMYSIFPRAFKACRITDIGVWVETYGCMQLVPKLAMPFRVCKISRPAMWATQEVMKMVSLVSLKISRMVEVRGQHHQQSLAELGSINV